MVRAALFSAAQPVYKVDLKLIIKKIQNFRSHAPLHCVSLCATAETVHICHSANVRSAYNKG